MEPRRSRRRSQRSKVRPPVPFLFATAVFGTLAGAVAAIVRTTPALPLYAFADQPAATMVLAQDGSILGRYATQGDRRPLPSVAAAGPLLPAALIAAEDKDFYHHPGVDPRASIRALWENIRYGHIVSGASTITQQAVKLTVFPRQERTWGRKLREMVLALTLERHLNKSQILLSYMNALYFGPVAGVPIYGVESAAMHIFGRHAPELTAAQAALLAAMVNDPVRASPWHDTADVVARSHMILTRMHRLGMIDTATWRRALREPVTSELARDRASLLPYESRAPYILAEVRREAPTLLAHAQRISLPEAQALCDAGGLRIQTSIDPAWQRTVARAAREVLGPASSPEGLQVGMVLLDNRTLGISATTAGREFAINQVDHTVAVRQPGSAIKPFAVYAPALDRGLITPGSIIADVPHHYDDPSAPHGDWFPQNWDHRFHGAITAQDALIRSLNGPAISLLRQVGTETGALYARLFGLCDISAPDRASLALAIGGTAGGVSVRQLAGAYAALANAGCYERPALVIRIQDARGRILFERKRIRTQVIRPATAAMLTDMLRQVVTARQGTAHGLMSAGLRVAVAGKTGTTDDNRDAWFVGYTSRYTLAIWLGYDLPRTGPTRATAIALRLFATALAHAPAPAGTDKILADDALGGLRYTWICRRSGDLATPLCAARGDAELALMPARTAPTRLCAQHELVLTTIFAGKPFLATDRTPVQDVHAEIVLQPTPVPGTREPAAPRSLDPRGGHALDWTATAT
ncbi:MAG: transglycosylase domain-containing protein [Firmicutes bacterium]|nr:transglycosylase domain-containing protein [Bacillota bacterium]